MYKEYTNSGPIYILCFEAKEGYDCNLTPDKSEIIIQDEELIAREIRVKVMDICNSETQAVSLKREELTDDLKRKVIFEDFNSLKRPKLDGEVIIVPTRPLITKSQSGFARVLHNEDHNFTVNKFDYPSYINQQNNPNFVNSAPYYMSIETSVHKPMIEDIQIPPKSEDSSKNSEYKALSLFNSNEHNIHTRIPYDLKNPPVSINRFKIDRHEIKIQNLNQHLPIKLKSNPSID